MADKLMGWESEGDPRVPTPLHASPALTMNGLRSELRSHSKGGGGRVVRWGPLGRPQKIVLAKNCQGERQWDGCKGHPYIKLYLLLCIIMFPLLACNVSLSPTANGTPGTSTSGASGTPTPTLNVWSKGGPGVEVRYEDWKSPSGSEDTVTIVRFDPHQINLSIGYQPAEPLLMSEWMHQEKAIAIINGGYFDQHDHATALVVSNGQASGTSYDGFGGMLSVDTQGNISLRSLHQQPYNPSSDQLEQATQSSPMLVLPGGQRADFDANAAGSRRSVVAVDKQGRLLFIVYPDLEFSLDELADQLVSSDLSINLALNLDGGASTGLFVNSGSQHVAIDSMAKLPIVIIVKAK